MHSLFDNINQVLKDTKLNENEGDHKYSSTQIQAPNEVAEKILAFSLSIPDDEIYRDPEDPSYGRELDSHITVKYGLKTVNAEDIEKLVKKSGVKEIDVVLKGTSLFEPEDKSYDVLKIDVQSPRLCELNKLFSTLPNSDTHPDYFPHLTIAYVKKGVGEKYSGKEEFAGINFKVDCLYFKSSTGDSKKIELSSEEVAERTIKQYLDADKPQEDETSEILKGNPAQTWVPWQ